jgi:hypothetical protein
VTDLTLCSVVDNVLIVEGDKSNEVVVVFGDETYDILDDGESIGPHCTVHIKKQTIKCRSTHEASILLRKF